MIHVGVIGAGLIGYERLAAIRTLASRGKPVALRGLYDTDSQRARTVATEFNTIAFASIDELLATKPDWVIVAVAHDVAIPITLKALEHGCSVLMEKPMGRDPIEARRLLDAGGARLKIGFNYRFFPGIRQALQDARNGVFGRMIGIDIILGHGCQPGLETSWKLNFERSGGGCLIDPGVHLLDICLLLAPDTITVAGGNSWSGFWNTGIEEDVRLLLTSRDLTMSLHISIVHWRSTFEMQIHGTDAYGIVSGRSRSYGSQSYRIGPRWGWRSAPSQAVSETLVSQSDGRETFLLEIEAALFPPSSTEVLWPAPCTAAEAFAVMNLLDGIRSHLDLPRFFPGS